MGARLDMSRNVPLPSKFHQAPGLHEEEHWQQVEGGDPSLILNIGEAVPQVLGPVLGSPGLEMYRHTEIVQQRATELMKTQEHFSRERMVVQFGMEKAQSILTNACGAK